MFHPSILADTRFKISLTALLLIVSGLCPDQRTEAQPRAEWQSPQLPQQNDPTLIRPAGFNVQQAVPQNSGTVQPVVQPNGQRVFNQNANNANSANNAIALPNNAPARSVVPAPAADNRSAVQPASWTSETSDINPSTASLNGNRTSARTPLELKPSSKDKARSLDKPTSTWAATLSMFFSLAVVLCFFLLVAWLVKKAQPASFLKLPGDVVQVMGRTPMAPRQQMYVVRFGSKLLLISHQPGQTQTLAEITDADEVQRLAGLLEANQPGSISNSFRDVLKQVTLGKVDSAPRSSVRMSRSQ